MIPVTAYNRIDKMDHIKEVIESCQDECLQDLDILY